MSRQFELDLGIEPEPNPLIRDLLLPCPVCGRLSVSVAVSGGLRERCFRFDCAPSKASVEG